MDSKDIGEQVLYALYDYEDLIDFAENIEELETLTTTEVFNRMTMNNADRILMVYLKFMGNPSMVNIVESGEGYIIYSLVSESIEPERLFLFTYGVNPEGLVDRINEAELTTFVTNAGWKIDTDLIGYPPMPPIG